MALKLGHKEKGCTGDKTSPLHLSSGDSYRTSLTFFLHSVSNCRKRQLRVLEFSFDGIRETALSRLLPKNFLIALLCHFVFLL